MKNLKIAQGDLVEVIAMPGSRPWTLCAKIFGHQTLLECIEYYDNPDTIRRPGQACMQGKVALVTKIIFNKLDQPVMYELNFSNEIYYCKAVLAHKYLRKL